MNIPTAKYVKFRNNLQTGDLILCVGKGFTSGVIKSVENDQCPPLVINSKRKYFTHVGAICRLGRHLFVLEADGETGRVEFRRFSRAYRTYDGEVFIVRPKFEDESGGIDLSQQEFLDNCLDAEGNKYDYGDILTQFWNHIKGKLMAVGHPDIAVKPHVEDEELYCSEIVNLASKYYFGAKNEWVTPHDIAYKLRDRILVKITEIKEHA